MNLREMLIANLTAAVTKAVDDTLGFTSVAPVTAAAAPARRTRKARGAARKTGGGAYTLGKRGKPPAFVAVHGGSKKLTEKYGVGAKVAVDGSGNLLVNGKPASEFQKPVAALPPAAAAQTVARNEAAHRVKATPSKKASK